MFTIEHEFDATVVTLVDEGAPHLQEDVTIQSFEDCVTVEQIDPRTDAGAEDHPVDGPAPRPVGGAEPARRGLPAEARPAGSS